MLLPEPHLLKFMKLTAGVPSPAPCRLSSAVQALVIYALIAAREADEQPAQEACTALAVRRKHAIFCIRSIGAKPIRR
jgi:hypothetical protein